MTFIITEQLIHLEDILKKVYILLNNSLNNVKQK